MIPLGNYENSIASGDRQPGSLPGELVANSAGINRAKKLVMTTILNQFKEILTSFRLWLSYG